MLSNYKHSFLFLGQAIRFALCLMLGVNDGSTYSLLPVSFCSLFYFVKDRRLLFLYIQLDATLTDECTRQALPNIMELTG